MRQLLILGLSGFCFLIFGQHGVGAQWGDRVELPLPPGSNSARGFLYKNSAAFSNNKRVVFVNNEDSGGGIYYSYSHDGINWSAMERFKPVDVPGINSIKVFRDSRDRLHLIWARPQPRAIYYTQMDSALNVVIDSVRIADNPLNGVFNGVYLNVDGQDRLHLMWHDGDVNTTSPAECYYSRSLDAGLTWSPAVKISDDNSQRSAFPRGQFNAYDGDTLAIAWRDEVSQYNWDIHMVTSTDGGANWSAPFTVNASTDYQGDPDVVIDPRGRIHMFYHNYPQNDRYNGMRIVYGWSDDLGQTWQPSSTFNNIVSDDSRSLLVEGSHYQAVTGTLWTFWKDESEKQSGGGIEIKAAYSTDRGESWSTPEFVTDNGSNAIGFKAILVLEDGTIGMNYESPNTPSSGLFRVYYRERQPLATALKTQQNIIPSTFTLEQNSPNPFNPATEIAFSLRGAATVNLSVYDGAGRLIRTLFRGHRPAGRHRFSFNAAGLAAGIYYYTLSDGKSTITKKMAYLP